METASHLLLFALFLWLCFRMEVSLDEQRQFESQIFSRLRIIDDHMVRIRKEMTTIPRAEIKDENIKSKIDAIVGKTLR